MRNFKRTLALVLAIVMMVGTFATLSVSAAWYDPAVAALEDAGVAVIGTNAGKKITRNEFVLWVAKIESRQLNDAFWDTQIAGTAFSDVTDEHHKAAIAYAYVRSFIIGNGDGTFAPDKNVTLAEAAAIIVRLMGYTSYVEFSEGDTWKHNNMKVCSQLRFFDDAFLSETGTYDPDYELTYGEAAHLLATITNLLLEEGDPNRVTTSKGIDLGDLLSGISGINVTKSYYVISMPRKEFTAVGSTDSLSRGTLLHLGGVQATRYTNEVDGEAKVVLAPVGGGQPVEVDGDDFTKFVRVSLGLAPTRDMANEEAEINVYQYCDVGSVISATVSKDTGYVVAVKTSAETTAIVDTYLQAKWGVINTSTKFANGATDQANSRPIDPADVEKFLGWTIRELKDYNKETAAENKKENLRVALPISYTEALATSWKNITKNADGVITSATLTFKGVDYKYSTGTKDLPIYVADANGDLVVDVDPVTGEVSYVAVTPDVAVKSLINAAQGEALVVFNDIDVDGKYDSVTVKESDPFFFVGAPNVAGNSESTYTYYSSISGGQSLGTAPMKGNALGAVIFNKAVHHSAGEGNDTAYNDFRTDGFSLVDKATGKMQLILRASNKHVIVDYLYNSKWAGTPEHYTVVDLATFNVGIIDNVDAFAVDGYYTAHITNTDGTESTVYIPYTPNATTDFDVTIGGATATYTFNSSEWCTFLADANKASVISTGIVGDVKNAGFRQATAAWMTSKFVQYAVNADNEIVALLGTDAVTKDSNDNVITGFVLGATKTETGDNTFKVRIAKSGEGVVDFTPYYLKARQLEAGDLDLVGNPISAADIGKFVIANPVLGGFAWADFDYVDVAARTVIQQSIDTMDDAYSFTDRFGILREGTGWGTFQVMRYNTNFYSHYGVNGSAYLLTDTPGSQYGGNYNFTRPLLAAINGGTSGANAWTLTEDAATPGEYFIFDHNGKQVVFQKKSNLRIGVAGVYETEVRANASSLFDWDNYATYAAIFESKSLINPAALAAAKTTAGRVLGSDLIYVTVNEDAGSKYLKAADSATGASTLVKTVAAASVSSSNLDAFYPKNDYPLAVVTGNYYYAPSAHESWMNETGKVDISAPSIVGAKTYSTPAEEALEGKFYTASYKRKVGEGPYYYRKWNADKKAFEYEYRFTKVTEYGSIPGKAYAEVDPSKTEMVQLYVADGKGGSLPVVADTPTKVAAYSGAEYYIDNNGLVFIIVGATVYKTDKNGAVVYGPVQYDYEAAGISITAEYEGIVPETKIDSYVSGGKKILTKYDTLNFKAADEESEGWFPGLYTMTFNGSTRQIPFYAKVIVVTPSTTTVGFSVKEYTVEEAARTGVFATSANFVEDAGNVTAIAVIGELAGKFNESSSSSSSSAPVADGSTLVYLNANAKAATTAVQYGNKWIVRSDKAGYAMPSGEPVAIYREYNTYTGSQATSIDLDIVGGHWYYIEKNGKIKSDATSVEYTPALSNEEQINGVWNMIFDPTGTRSFNTAVGLAVKSDNLTGTTKNYIEFVKSDSDGKLYAVSEIKKVAGATEAEDVTYLVPSTTEITLDSRIADCKVLVDVTDVADCFGKKVDGVYSEDTSGNFEYYRIYDKCEGMIYETEGLVAGSDFKTVYTLSATTVNSKNAAKFTFNVYRPYDMTVAVAKADAEETRKYVMKEVDGVKSYYPLTGNGYTDADPDNVGALLRGDADHPYLITYDTTADTTTPSYLLAKATKVAKNAFVSGKVCDTDVYELYLGTKEISYVLFTEKDGKYYEVYGVTYDVGNDVVNVAVSDITFDFDEALLDAKFSFNEAFDSKYANDAVVYAIAFIGTGADTKFINKLDATYAELATHAVKYLASDFTTVATGASGDSVTKVIQSDDGDIFVYEDGIYYVGDENFHKAETNNGLKNLSTGTITKATADGKTTANIDGKSNVDVSSYKFAFFYHNADGTQLFKAGDNTNVTIATSATYAAKIKTQQDAYNAAKASYEAAKAKTYLSPERLAYYKNNLDAAEAELLAKKDSLLDTYYNGQFWNVPNSPFLKYQSMAAQSFQNPNAKLEFNYILVDGVYCVFSDSFNPQ